ncbi:MAG: 3-oxoacyl-ACP synthase III [Planctomycetales bacterium]|nr:3-oxoacyl-ACP synthase III [Planctomycetales bacterium]
MLFDDVCIESIGYSLPDDVVASEEIEDCLAPLYDRLRLPMGRLELMTGIRERRFFPRGARPSQISALSGARAIEAADIDPSRIGALIHGSVCRDYLEPATACSVHHALGLSPRCHLYDVSNACLGILTGALQVAHLIQAGVIEAGMVVGSELGRPLVERTIEHLNADESLSRQDVKQFFASLTIGSASAAILLTHRNVSAAGTALLGAATLAHTEAHALCQSDGLTEFMRTDSEQLLHSGVSAAIDTFDILLERLKWQRSDVQRTICHQVGAAHRKLMLEGLELPEETDYATFETLGNTGSAALPVALAMAAADGTLQAGENVALLGIGSGIICQMAGLRWGATRVAGGPAHLA